MEALAPFRTHAFERFAGDPQPLPYLSSESDQARGGIDLTLEVYILSQQMRERELSPFRLSSGNFSEMYWTLAQMITHHSSNGCNLQAGDLFASGAVSGPTNQSRGSLLELTWHGTESVELPTDETRRL
jgi:fumarylacetoacetase